MQKKTAFVAFLAVVTLLPTVGMAQQPLRWETSLENAQRLAGQTNRLVLIQFWAPWCGVCKRMEAEVLPQPSVTAQINANYVPVKINADHFPATAKQYGVTALPTTVITTPQGQLLDSMRGRVEAAEFVARLDRIAVATRQRGGAVYAKMPATTSPNIAATSPSTPNPAVVTQPPTLPPTSVNAPAMSNNNGPALGPTAPAVVANTRPAAGNATGNAAGLSDDRYADFFRRAQGDPAAPIAQPSSTLPPPINNVPLAPQTPTTPALPTNAPIQTAMNQPYPSAQMGDAADQASVPANPAPAYGRQTPTPSFSAPAAVAQNNPAMPVQPSGPSTQVPAIQAPLALDGFCPVTLTEKQQWTPGDRRWGAVHRGRTYLFLGPEEQRRFFSDPDRYAPAVSGNDIILATEQGQAVPGMREHGVFFGNRIYLFASEATLERFAKNPNQYANQAMAAVRPGAYSGTNPAVGR